MLFFKKKLFTTKNIQKTKKLRKHPLHTNQKTKTSSILYNIYWNILDKLCIRYIYYKISPSQFNPEIHKKPSSFAIWIIGLYSIIFTYTESKHDRISQRIQQEVNAFGALISQKPIQPEMWHEASRIQNMKCPPSPDFFNIKSTMNSFLFSKEDFYKPAVKQIKNYIISNKENLEGAILIGIDLSDSNMNNANLKNALIQDSNFNNTFLINANLERAKLTNVSMVATSLRSSNLKVTEFKKCSLIGADLTAANLYYAGFYGVNLSAANLFKTNLSTAIFCDLVVYNAPKTVFTPEKIPAEVIFNDFTDTKLKRTVKEKIMKQIRHKNIQPIQIKINLLLDANIFTASTTFDTVNLTNYLEMISPNKITYNKSCNLPWINDAIQKELSKIKNPP